MGVRAATISRPRVARQRSRPCYMDSARINTTANGDLWILNRVVCPTRQISAQRLGEKRRILSAWDRPTARPLVLVTAAVFRMSPVRRLPCWRATLPGSTRDGSGDADQQPDWRGDSQPGSVEGDRAALHESYRTLVGESRLVAVRSSARRGFRGACSRGKWTALPEHDLEAGADCFASCFSPRALAYRKLHTGRSRRTPP
jgi:hypothetical protein